MNILVAQGHCQHHGHDTPHQPLYTLAGNDLDFELCRSRYDSHKPYCLSSFFGQNVRLGFCFSTASVACCQPCSISPVGGGAVLDSPEPDGGVAPESREPDGGGAALDAPEPDGGGVAPDAPEPEGGGEVAPDVPEPEGGGGVAPDVPELDGGGGGTSSEGPEPDEDGGSSEGSELGGGVLSSAAASKA